MCRNSLDCQATSLSCGHVKGNPIIQAEEQEGEGTINSSSMFQNGSHQNIDLPFLIDSKSMNLGETSRTTNSLNQPLVLGCHHSHAFVCSDEFPITLLDLFFSHVHSNLDLECMSVKVDIHIKTSFALHFPMCPTIRNTSTCGRDTHCSLSSSFNELSPSSTQDSEVVHNENDLNSLESSHSSSSFVLHEYNSSG